MWQYLVYFLAGGVLVATIAYVGNHHGGTLAALVTSVPVVFLLSLALMYRSSGVGGSLEYVRATLMFLPVFIAYAVLTAWLLPRMNSLAAMIPGLVLYLVPAYIIRSRQLRGAMRQEQVIFELHGELRESEDVETVSEEAVLSR